MKKFWRDARPAILGSMAAGLVRSVGASLRLQVEGLERLEAANGGYVLCGWHGKSFIPGFVHRGTGMWVIISHSRDGEVQNRVFTKLGYRVIRGSTGRGGARAAVEGIRVLRKGENMALTPDGPRGPSGVVQGGVMLMAQKSGAALFPVGLGSKPSWRVPAWDRYMIPFPFARASYLIGEPILIPHDANEAEVERLRLQLQGAIQALDEEAERRVR